MFSITRKDIHLRSVTTATPIGLPAEPAYVPQIAHNACINQQDATSQETRMFDKPEDLNGQVDRS